jgi:formamidopyrimidine-DNA glycosylase
MPELPEVETVRRGLEPAMTGAAIKKLTVNRKDLRFPFPVNFQNRIEGATILGLRRRAKYLLADLSSGETLIMHLGMSGRFAVESPHTRMEPGSFHADPGRHLVHDHVIFRLSSDFIVTYNDVRRFGFMDLHATDLLDQSPHFRAMGIEPLGNAFSAAAMAVLFAGKTAPLKAALLDQRLVAGLGNIYVCEALNRARLSPRRSTGSLVTKTGQASTRLDILAREIRLVLEEAILAGGSTLRDYVQTDGSLGYFQHRFRAYDREGDACRNDHCNGIINRMVQSGRSTFYCSDCQK